jgi:hypothetical protein
LVLEIHLEFPLGLGPLRSSLLSFRNVPDQLGLPIEALNGKGLDFHLPIVVTD